MVANTAETDVVKQVCFILGQYTTGKIILEPRYGPPPDIILNIKRRLVIFEIKIGDPEVGVPLIIASKLRQYKETTEREYNEERLPIDVVLITNQSVPAVLSQVITGMGFHLVKFDKLSELRDRLIKELDL